MFTEYIVAKEDMQVKIIIDFFVPVLSVKAKYRVKDIEILPKRKRKWQSVFYSIKRDSSDYRFADDETKKKILQEECYKYVTEQDIRVALQKAYEELKPVFSLDIFA